jgi:hypothetical protein
LGDFGILGFRNFEIGRLGVEFCQAVRSTYCDSVKELFVLYNWKEKYVTVYGEGAAQVFQQVFIKITNTDKARSGLKQSDAFYR